MKTQLTEAGSAKIFRKGAMQGNRVNVFDRNSSPVLGEESAGSGLARTRPKAAGESRLAQGGGLFAAPSPPCAGRGRGMTAV